eukprot:TRINITY_DN303_c0_g5_i1.p1 TRINITY_DN303_c0_g5~~TRINITY_DN303_c0_g5_i1.p1  ORF type:complete len:531 (-),score=225.77 TRINITY_DN303_c0_g5_i1:92-1684(-)
MFKNCLKLKNCFPSFIKRYSTLNLNLNFQTIRGNLTKEKILNSPSTPIISPSYPRGPYNFKNREYFIISYESDPEAIRDAVPEPLKPAGNTVLFEWIAMPDSTGFGAYQESGTVIPCTYNGMQVNYTCQMFLDCDPPISGGREIWGFPKKYAHPIFGVKSDTVYGTLHYAGQQVAQGTMAYKYKVINEELALKSLSKTQVNLKLIPDVDWTPKIAQLIAYNLTNIKLIGSWEGPAKLHLIEHVNAPACNLPVKKVITGKHYLADITLPYGRVLYDYLEEKKKGNLSKESEKILEIASMPPLAPSYQRSKLFLENREYLRIYYESDEQAIRNYVPSELIVNNQNIVIIQWITTNGTGVGDYSKLDVLIPCQTQNGINCLFSVQSYMNNSAPITMGREVWGEPQKYAEPKLQVEKDTLNATLNYCSLPVAFGSMSFKHHKIDHQIAQQLLNLPHVNIKLLPNEQGNAQIAQLVLQSHEQVQIYSAWEGPARLHLIPHVNAPLSELPVKKVIGAQNILCDLVIPQGKVIHNYL